MAEEEEEKENEDRTKESKSGNKKKLFILIGVGVIVIALSIGGTLVALSLLGENKPEMEEMAEETEGGEPEEPLPDPAIYYPLKPPIIVTYDVRGRQRYAQVELTLLIREDGVVAAIESHMPMIRNALVMIISGQTYEEAQTAEGKELLRQASLKELQRLMEKEIGKPGIEQVLYSNFVMQ